MGGESRTAKARPIPALSKFFAAKVPKFPPGKVQLQHGWSGLSQQMYREDHRQHTIRTQFLCYHSTDRHLCGIGRGEKRHVVFLFSRQKVLEPTQAAAMRTISIAHAFNECYPIKKHSLNYTHTHTSCRPCLFI